MTKKLSDHDVKLITEFGNLMEDDQHAEGASLASVVALLEHYGFTQQDVLGVLDPTDDQIREMRAQIEREALIDSVLAPMDVGVDISVQHLALLVQTGQVPYLEATNALWERGFTDGVCRQLLADKGVPLPEEYGDQGLDPEDC